jgi:hypothetical protein
MYIDDLPAIVFVDCRLTGRGWLDPSGESRAHRHHHEIIQPAPITGSGFFHWGRRS